MMMHLNLLKTSLTVGTAALTLVGAAELANAAGSAVTYRQQITNDMRKCAPGAGPAARVTVNGVRTSKGKIRVQSYRGTSADWLEKGRWLARIEVPARAGSMTVCVPLPEAGVYGIAVRHDVNGNGKMDTNPFGMPTEPFAFSNSAKGNMGEAKFCQKKKYFQGSSRVYPMTNAIKRLIPKTK